MPGPLPARSRRRKNAPTIPTTNLPAAGRTGPAPRVPSWVTLHKSGQAWWKWAWHTPQAAGWVTTGHLSFAARRASLEDDLAALDHVESLDALDLLGAESAAAFKALIFRLAGLATGRLAVHKRMDEMDKVLGLTPKGTADLRWTVVAEADPGDEPAAGDEVTARREERRSRLSAS